MQRAADSAVEGPIALSRLDWPSESRNMDTFCDRVRGAWSEGTKGSIYLAMVAGGNCDLGMAMVVSAIVAFGDEISR